MRQPVSAAISRASFRSCRRWAWHAWWPPLIRGSRSLVLLDEVATGTDPAEGAALARAVVEAFCARGAALVVTTHYETLKAASLSDPRLRTASVGLDTERMEPTFELLLGVPGAS